MASSIGRRGAIEVDLSLGVPAAYPQPTVNHRVYVNDTLHRQLLSVEWYDHAAAYLGCVRDLQELHNLSATTPLKIVSNGVPYTITDPAAFRQWVAQVFEQGMTFGFHERLQESGS
jgi:hypothetical protein